MKIYRVFLPWKVFNFNNFSHWRDKSIIYILLKYVNILFYLQIEFLSPTANYKRSAFCLCWNIFNHILISHSKSVKNSMRWHYKIRINRVSHIILDRYWLLNRFSESEILRKIIHFMKLWNANIKICLQKIQGFSSNIFWRWSLTRIWSDDMAICIKTTKPKKV